jgi:hypothetical protein
MGEIQDNNQDDDVWVSVKLKQHTVDALELRKIHPRQGLYEVIDELLLKEIVEEGVNENV